MQKNRQRKTGLRSVSTLVSHRLERIGEDDMQARDLAAKLATSIDIGLLGTDVVTRHVVLETIIQALTSLRGASNKPQGADGRVVYGTNATALTVSTTDGIVMVSVSDLLQPFGDTSTVAVLDRGGRLGLAEAVAI